VIVPSSKLPNVCLTSVFACNRLVYDDSSPGAWPRLVGRLGAAGEVLPQQQLTGSDFFKALDTYLKEQQVRFQQLFESHDRDRSGTLDARELAQLVQDVMGKVATVADVKFLQVSLLDALCTRPIHQRIGQEIKMNR
jgi:hypothetical protein